MGRKKIERNFALKILKKNKEFKKMVTITLYARERDTDVQNRLLDSVGEGEGGMI